MRNPGCDDWKPQNYFDGTVPEFKHYSDKGAMKMSETIIRFMNVIIMRTLLLIVPSHGEMYSLSIIYQKTS